MRAVALVLCGALTACARTAPVPDPAEASSPAGSSRVSPLPSALPAVSASSQVSDVAPRVARSAPREAQERAAWEILAGRRPAAELPIESYDPALRAPPTGERDLGAAVPEVREVAIDAGPGLPPEVVRRISRQSFGRYRLCYENALRGNPGLEGTVITTFVIDLKGTVLDVKTVGGTPAMAELDACIARALSTLSFPLPERRMQVKLTHGFRLGISR